MLRDLQALPEEALARGALVGIQPLGEALPWHTKAPRPSLPCSETYHVSGAALNTLLGLFHFLMAVTL